MKVVPLRNGTFRVAYLDLNDDGGAPPRIYLHGLGSSSITTFPAIATHLLLRDTRSLLIDLPGFGYSTGPDDWSFSVEDQGEIVVELLDALGIYRFALVGHSMGGSIAISIAHRWPDRVVSLSVAEPNLDPGRGTLSNHIARRTEEEFVSVGYPMLIRGMLQQAKRNEGNASVFIGTARQAQPQAMHRAAVSLLSDRSPTFRQQLIQATRITMPRLFIAGALSNEIPPSDLIPHGVSFVDIPNVGHVMMDDDPESFVRALSGASEAF